MYGPSSLATVRQQRAAPSAPPFVLWCVVVALLQGRDHLGSQIQAALVDTVRRKRRDTRAAKLPRELLPRLTRFPGQPVERCKPPVERGGIRLSDLGLKGLRARVSHLGDGHMSVLEEPLNIDRLTDPDVFGEPTKRHGGGRIPGEDAHNLIMADMDRLIGP